MGNPPPVPIKRSRTFRQSSSSEPPNTPSVPHQGQLTSLIPGPFSHCSLIPSLNFLHSCPRGESYPTEASTGEKPHLTPHPRSNTLDKRRSSACAVFHTIVDAIMVIADFIPGTRYVSLGRVLFTGGGGGGRFPPKHSSFPLQNFY